MKKNILIFLGLITSCYALISFNSGCAQIGFPTGGARDSLAPVLSKASPENYRTNFTGNKITLSFDEYIEIKDLQSNLLVSPLPKNNPSINSNLKTISIKLKDSLKPNTTYSINFGDAIADVHEGNVLKNFTYTFSTGSFIDSLQVKGKVLLAESGKPDSTLLVFLYRNAVDSEVISRKPDYVTKANSTGDFTFSNLPAASFKIYALKDGDGGKTYNGKSELFAFNDAEVNTAEPAIPVILFAYAEEKSTTGNNPPPAAQKKPAEKKLKYNTSASAKLQDILQPLQINFGSGLKLFDASKIIISDTNYRPLTNLLPGIDSTRKQVSVKVNWQPETEYIVILPKEAFQDSADNFLEKTDTIRFTTKKLADYGSIVLRFKKIDITKHPVIQFLQSDAVKFSYPVTSTEWSNKLFTPGEYEVRILYDTNNNGIWDPGDYKSKLQPERAVSLPQRLNIKADWENEREIQL